MPSKHHLIVYTGYLHVKKAVHSSSRMARAAVPYSSGEETDSHLARLSQKPGVQSTLIISRDTGAIVRTSGLVSRDEAIDPESALPASDIAVNGYTGRDGENVRGLQNAEDVARLVWNFVNVAGGLVQDLNGAQDDELKLLRLRTKKSELVIVPGKAFLVRCESRRTC